MRWAVVIHSVEPMTIRRQPAARARSRHSATRRGPTPRPCDGRVDGQHPEAAVAVDVRGPTRSTARRRGQRDRAEEAPLRGVGHAMRPATTAAATAAGFGRSSSATSTMVFSAAARVGDVGQVGGVVVAHPGVERPVGVDGQPGDLVEVFLRCLTDPHRRGKLVGP